MSLTSSRDKASLMPIPIAVHPGAGDDQQKMSTGHQPKKEQNKPVAIQNLNIKLRYFFLWKRTK